MTQAPEDYPPAPSEHESTADSRHSPLVPSQRPAPAPVLPQAAPGDAAIGQAQEAPHAPMPAVPPQAAMQAPPVEMVPPGAGAPPGLPGAPTIPPGWQYPPPGYAPIRHPRKSSKLATSLIVVLLVATSVFAGALVNGWRPPMPQAETGSIEGLAVQPGEGTVPSPGPNATESEILSYLKEQAQLVLDASSESLVNGSLEGWLAAYDPTLHDQMTGRFNTLSAMQVSRFDYQIASGPLEDATGAVPLYDVTVALSYCFVEPADVCKAADIVFDTRWRAGQAGMTMIEVEDSKHGEGPHPWEVTDMVAAVGERTVVAIPEDMADELDAALETSEAAAENADKWAYWEKPDRYVVYIAGDEEFDSWFGGLWDSEDVLGFALPLNGTIDGERQPSTYATVMGVERTGWGKDLTSVIRHELGHAVTLWAAPSDRYDDDTWWMVEGIAEYIDHGDRSLDDYERIFDVTDYVAEGGCATDILPPDQDDDTLAGSGKYGCGFLGVHYMIDTYGVEQFVEFFGATAREGQSAPDAADAVYGKSYADLMEEITAFIAQTV